LKECVGDVGKMTFQELCVSSHSAADFLALASNLKILILTDIPKMQLKHKNEARRFITLIDTLYENKIKLVLTAFTHVSDLLTGDIITDLDDSDRLLMDDLKMKKSTSLFTGAEELFAFERAISRLEEMQSAEWIGTELQDTITKSILTVGPANA
jgi:protein AFG1